MGALALMAVVWFGTGAFGLLLFRRYLLLSLIWGLVLLAHLLAPNLPALKYSGGSAAGWLVLGGIVALSLGYREWVRRLRSRAASVRDLQPQVPDPGPFQAEELDRYARHILLHEIGGPGQAALKRARVLVVGAGGLGSPVLMYLAASGVGTIGVIDDDVVEVSNLQRQIIHTGGSVGQSKVASAAAAMAALNPHVQVVTHAQRLEVGSATDLIAGYDLVMDGTDNFDTRYLVNKVCTALGKPLISGAITQWEGQLSVFDPARGGPCYACVFPDRPLPGMVPTCAEAGVAAPLPGIIGSMMAMEAVKLICNAGEGLRGRLLILDALYLETRVITVQRQVACPVCSGMHAAAS